MIAGLVNRGLATIAAEKVPAGGKLIDVGKAGTTPDADGVMSSPRSRYLNPSARDRGLRRNRF